LIAAWQVRGKRKKWLSLGKGKAPEKEGSDSVLIEILKREKGEKFLIIDPLYCKKGRGGSTSRG